MISDNTTRNWFKFFQCGDLSFWNKFITYPWYGYVKCTHVHRMFIMFVGGVCNLVISVDCSLNYSHHKYNTKHYNRAKEME